MNAEVQRRWERRTSLWKDAFSNVDLAGKRVLDAGTGEGYFTEFLAAGRPSRLVSITCDPEHARNAQAKFDRQSLGPVDVQVADLTNMPQVPDESFDIVAGDYLIGSMAAYTPYREIDCLKELVRVLAPGGRLILTGWEVWPEVRNPTERLLRQLFKLREAAHHLRGGEPYREFPRSWIQARLAEMGIPAEKVCTVPDVHRDLEWLITNVRKVIDRIPQDYLRDALLTRWNELANPLREDPALSFGLEFGRLYAVVAVKLQGAVLLR